MSRADSGCPECSGTLTASDGETVCGDCGLVVAEDRVDRGPEWRVFDPDDRDRVRTGAPRDPSRHDRGLTTEIGRGERAASGRKRRRRARMRRQHQRTRITSKAERNRVYGFTEIRRIVSNLGLPRGVRDGACRLFESAQEADLLRGRSIEGFAAAVVYATCRTRTDGTTRTEREVCEYARADVEELRTAYDALNRELGLPTGPIDPREYLARFASELDLDQAVEARAREIAAEVHEGGLAGGRDPTGVAGACLYAAAADHEVELTQAEAAEVADVSPVTLRGAYYALPVHD